MASLAEVAALYFVTTFALVRGFQTAVKDYSLGGRIRAAIWLAVACAVMGVPV